MACRDTFNMNIGAQYAEPEPDATENPEVKKELSETRDTFMMPLTGMPLFGVDSSQKANTVLQHNLTMLEWVTKNKLPPNFWGRNINGENSLDKEEIEYLHDTGGCKIAPLYQTEEQMLTEQDGVLDAEKAVECAEKLGFHAGHTLYVKIKNSSEVTMEYMLGFAKHLQTKGLIPGMYADTDAHFDFSHQFSRGAVENADVFKKCRIWAVSPSLTEYDKTTNAHILYPDYWGPYSPSCMPQDEIAIWQYGIGCHPVNDYTGRPTSFNINLVKKADIVLEEML